MIPVMGTTRIFTRHEGYPIFRHFYPGALASPQWTNVSFDKKPRKQTALFTLLTWSTLRLISSTVFFNFSL